MKFSRKTYNFFYYSGIVIIGFLLITFTFRSPVASWFVGRQVVKFNRVYGAELKISKVRILGLASIRLVGITLKPINGEYLVKVDTAYASIGILKLFLGRLSLHNVELNNTWFTPTGNGAKSNYMFLLERKVSATDTVRATTNFAVRADQMLRFVFDKIPLSLRIRNFNVVHRNIDHLVELHIADLAIRDHFFRSVIGVREDSIQQEWTVAGRIDNSNRLAEFRLYRADGEKLTIPYLQRKWQAGMNLDTLAFRFGEQEGSGEAIRLGGYATIRGLVADHRMISATALEFDKLAVDYTFRIGEDFIEIDSTTQITFNRIDFHPYIRFRPNPTKQFTVSVHKSSFAAQDLFSSFPVGLFTNLDGIRVRGKLSWDLDFFLDLSQPDSLKFETSLNRQQFSVLSYGNTNLAKINTPFVYTAWEHDQPVRTFVVGPENPDFRRLDQISRYLPLAAMTSEDGGFYQHRGFLPDAFRESMILNIKERRFARGGSTISMQLVKNVFLNRNKTVARKLEEALIVWLIENQGLTTKDRMMEVYLNVIEWGPNIYGANEASRFYFNKDAAKLSLAEAIFMASIIPRPKWFKYSFDDQGHLRESNADFYRLVSEKMVKKGWITASEAEKLVPDVELKGAARMLLKHNDTVEMVKW